MEKIRNTKISRKRLKDSTVLYLYYLNSETNFNDLDNCTEEDIIILNKNNGNKMNNFLEEYIKNRIMSDPELDYEMLRMFDDLEENIFKMTIKNMLPNNLFLTKFTDNKTIDKLSDDYNIPKHLLHKYIKGRK